MPTSTKPKPTETKLSPSVITQLNTAARAVLEAGTKADQILTDAQGKAETVQSGALWKAVYAAHVLVQAGMKRAEARNQIRAAFAEANGGIYDGPKWDSTVAKVLTIAFESTPADLERYRVQKVGFNTAYAALSKPQASTETKSWTREVESDADGNEAPAEPAPVQVAQPRDAKPAAKHARLVDAIASNESVFTDLMDAMTERGLVSYPLVSAIIDRAFDDAQKAEFVRVLLRDETAFRAAWEMTHQNPTI